jgi:hypothetical protein
VAGRSTFNRGSSVRRTVPTTCRRTVTSTSMGSARAELTLDARHIGPVPFYSQNRVRRVSCSIAACPFSAVRTPGCDFCRRFLTLLPDPSRFDRRTRLPRRPGRDRVPLLPSSSECRRLRCQGPRCWRRPSPGLSVELMQPGQSGERQINSTARAARRLRSALLSAARS